MTKNQSTQRKSTSLSAEISHPDCCQFSYADGRTCRMPRSKKHRSLCVFHARKEHELLGAEEVAGRMVSLSGEFKTATDINHALGELFRLVAENRIPHREAVSLAYIAQLLLQSQPQVRSEIRVTMGHDAWNATVHRALTAPATDDEDDDSISDGHSAEPVSNQTRSATRLE